MTYEEALAWLYARRRTGERGTHRVRALLARLGHPEAGFLAVHVLGTNGKGSVVAYLEAAFRAAGLAYGAYTSPHLVDFRERIRTHLGPVPREAVVRFVAWAREEAWEEPPGFFDLATALAFLHFRERGVGLEVARKVAEERGAPLYVLDPEDPLFALPAPPGLRGAYQEENARLAAAALRLLGLPEAAIARGLREARHPGRMERFLLKGVEVYLDGAHNPPAAEALAREFSAYHLVFGAFPRKDVKGVLAHLLPKARSVRYARAGEGALGGELGTPFFEDPWEALEDALARAREDGLPVLATGSLYLVGRLRERLVAGLGEDLP